ncbi:MoxR family ATPase [Mesorhizobium sp. M0478]|uniref:AAA family ATPase n=1 Tax=Mesorhizobium sp. M0478 TaxID=2956947 RepID=UPI003339B79C
MWFKTFPEKDPKEVVPLMENGREVEKKGKDYVFNPDLIAAVDVARGLGRPLLVSGEPGCGKTELGYAIARRLGIPRVHFFSTKSNSEARDLFYTYDAIGRFRHAQGDGAQVAPDVADYIEFQALGRAILDAHDRKDIDRLLVGRRPYQPLEKPGPTVVIIDEVDKASRDFPNDVLREIEDLAFRVPELSGRIAGEAETPGSLPAEQRPIVVITSNEERQLPDAFLRRCVFHEIAFPTDEKILRAIIASGLRKKFGKKQEPPGQGVEMKYDLPDKDKDSLLRLFNNFRNEPLEKKPGISELIDAAALLAYPPAQAPRAKLAARMQEIGPALAKLKNDRMTLGKLLAEPKPEGA